MEYVDELDTVFLAALGIAGGVTADDLELSLQHDGPITTVTCRGKLSAATSERFGQALILALGSAPEELHIDTTRVSKIGFGGIAELLRAARCAHESGTWLRIEQGPIVEDALDDAGLLWLGRTDVHPDIDRDRERALRFRAHSRMNGGGRRDTEGSSNRDRSPF